MKSNILLSVLFLFLFISCRLGVDFEVQNKSIKTIDSLFISNGYTQITFRDIKTNETKRGFLDFKKNQPKHDGNYSVDVFSNNLLENEFFGYYTNGLPSNSMYKILIEKDTLIIKEIPIK